jgi:large subunit ribosomal protein L32
MAVPKRKVSHARKMKRRSSVWKLETPTNLVKCPQCGEVNLAYRVCKSCGYYKGVEVVAKKETAEK